MLKRSFDIVMSVVGLVVLFPVIVIAGLVVLLTMGWPVFYFAKRAGRGGRPFSIIKFRSMNAAAPGQATHHSGDDDPRITSVGRFLRRSKFDELPQLVNVLIGNMSLVGPRPETLEYTELYTEEQMEILTVRPGITDYASIEFADLGSILGGDDPDKVYFENIWGPKMELRIKYVREQSFLGDLKLIVQTLAVAVNPGRKN